MRRFVYMLLALLTWFFAAMYRSSPLLLLFLTETVLLALMAVQSVLLRGRVSAAFPQEKQNCVRGTPCVCRVRLHNKSLLPVSRVSVSLALSGQELFSTETLTGKAYPRGDTDLDFAVNAPCCGSYVLELYHMTVCDYLALFPSPKDYEIFMVVRVFPAPCPVRLRLDSTVWEQKK